MVAHWSVPSPQRYREARQCARRKFLIWVNIVVRVNIMKSVLWIRIRIRIQHYKWIRILIWIRIRLQICIWILFQIRIWIQNFDDQKLKKKKLKFFSFLLWSKIAIHLSLGLHKGPPSYRRGLQPSKENIQHFKRWNLLTVFYFSGPFLPWIHFALGSGSRDPDKSVSNLYPDSDSDPQH